MAQLICFGIIYWKYWNTGLFVSVRSYIGHGLPIAKASGACISLNAGAILLAVCRRILTYLRSTFLKKMVPFDGNIDFHMFAGVCILFWSLVHTSAHYYNDFTVEKKL